MNDYAIDIQNLHKVFETRVGFLNRKDKKNIAINNISFTVQKGELFGLLGPNGAGKTTTLKILSTILLPTSGSISIFGNDIIKQTQIIRKKIGFTFGGSRGLYGRLSAVDNLRYFAELYGIEPAITRKRIPELLELVGLQGRGDDRIETYSSGMQQRLHIARALFHNPDLIFLDEPTIGIDPVGARDIRNIIKELIASKKTIVLTTHYMAEAEELCNRIAIINKGSIVALNTPSALKKRIGGDTLFTIEMKDDNIIAVQEKLLALDSHLTIQISDVENIKRISITSSKPEAIIHWLIPFCHSQENMTLEIRHQTLEDVYISIIKEELP